MRYWNLNHIHNTLSFFPSDAPYVTPTSKSCSWSIKSPTPKSAVILTQEFMHRVSEEICQNFNCGKAFVQNTIEAPPNSTCLTDCIYHNSYLRNCSTVVGNGCLKMSEIICGKFWNLGMMPLRHILLKVEKEMTDYRLKDMLLLLQVTTKSDCQEAAISVLDVWRCGTMDNGARCVMMSGINRTRMWSVLSWTADMHSLLMGRAAPIPTVKVLYSWMSWTAPGRRGACGSVLQWGKVMTVDIKKMLEWCVQVWLKASVYFL